MVALCPRQIEAKLTAFPENQPGCKFISYRREYEIATRMSHSETENLQKVHYDKIAPDYTAHYGDDWSQRYRDRFIHKYMFRNIPVAGKNALEAMCGSGETTRYLRDMGAFVTGIDISEEEVNNFRRRWPDCRGVCASILQTGLESDAYDCVAAVGGLHHVHPYVPEAIHEIHRILKPGGYFCFAEPHEGSCPDVLRRYWYKHDPLFAKNEHSIDVEALKGIFALHFDFVSPEQYKGNIAYLCVLNSMIFRINVSAKRFFSPALLRLEAMIEKIQGRRFSCFVICQWRKKDGGGSPGISSNHDSTVVERNKL